MCLREWLKKSNNCPLCKYDMMNGYDIEEDS